MKNKLLLLGVFLLLGHFASFANCPGDTAKFTTIAGICNSKSVSFVNTSVGGITTYFWDFGDGTTLADTSNLQNPPAYIYPTNGVYTATLITDRNMPCADTFSVVVNMAYVTASFTSNSPQCITNAVAFTNASVAGSGSTITNYKWNFGDTGNADTSIVQNPSYTYSFGNNSFLVKLVVTSSNGCKDSVSNSVGIQSSVVVNAGVNITTCDNNTTVNLVGSIQNAGGGFWTGSGNFSSTTSLTPIYTPTQEAKDNGVDTLTLTSFSSPYCPNKTDTLLIFFNPGPTANVGSDIIVCQDVASIPVTATLNGSTGVVWHTNSTEGTFTDDSLITTFYHPSATDTAAGSVDLYVVTTGNGICASTTDTLTVYFTPVPTVLIKTEDSVCSGVAIALDVTTSTGAGTWSASGTGTFLPDNTTLNGVYYPTNADNQAGMVTLYFTSSNNGDCQPVVDSLVVTIKQSPTVAFGAVSACAGDAVQFNDSSTAAGAITNWNWVFGDLSLPSLSQSPSHEYSSCGSKTVTLVVTADNGCIDTKTESVTVYCIPVANYTAIGVCLKEGTEFTNTSTVSNSSIATTNWDFGDATTSIENNPTHMFPASGSFVVTLVATSAQGCVDTLTQTVSLVAGPTANFTISDATAEISQEINFQDASAGAVDWLWNFGDGSNTSTLANPSHTYTVGGVYDICLIATDPSGCTDTICQQEIVATKVHGPSAFSPNGDGQNDVFYAIGGPFKNIEFKVYNNWGEVIFMSDKQSLGWDGKYKGLDQAVGVYIYTIVGTTEDDKEYKLSGDITLLR